MFTIWLTSSLTCFAVRSRPAIHTLSVPQLVTHIMAEVVVAWSAHFVAFSAVVMLITAHTDGVVNAGNQSFIFHLLFLLPGINHPSVDAAHNQLLIIWTKRENMIQKQMLKMQQKIIFALCSEYILVLTIKSAANERNFIPS